MRLPVFDWLFYRRLYIQERDNTRRMGLLVLDLIQATGWDDHANPEIRGKVRQLQTAVHQIETRR